MTLSSNQRLRSQDQFNSLLSSTHPYLLKKRLEFAAFGKIPSALHALQLKQHRIGIDDDYLHLNHKTCEPTVKRVRETTDTDWHSAGWCSSRDNTHWVYIGVEDVVLRMWAEPMGPLSHPMSYHLGESYRLEEVLLYQYETCYSLHLTGRDVLQHVCWPYTLALTEALSNITLDNIDVTFSTQHRCFRLLLQTGL